jgi:endonuclease YncB( thermonuclease family)
LRRPGLAALLLASGLVAAAGRPPALPFVEDDYARALAEARARKLPLFVETWAPW